MAHEVADAETELSRTSDLLRIRDCEMFDMIRHI